MKKCFTINQFRTEAEIASYYDNLVKPRIYHAAEIFYPYQLPLSRQIAYEEALKVFLTVPNFDFILHLPYGPLNNLATPEFGEVWERLKGAIAFGSRLNVKRLTIHCGELIPGMSKEEATILSIANLKKIAEYVKPLGMTLMVENLISSNELNVHPEEILQYLQAINLPNVKFTFDSGHAYVAGYKNLSSYIFILKDYLSHLHLSDNDGTKDAHLLFGLGKIDFIDLFQTLKTIDYQGYYCAEVFHEGCHDLIKMARLMEQWHDNNSC